MKTILLTPLEITYLLQCRKYEGYGHRAEKQFTKEYGLLRLFSDFPELLALKGGKKAGGTIEEYLLETCEDYLRARFYKIMQTYHKMIEPKDKGHWNYSDKKENNTVVAALNSFAPQLLAVDPEYVPPDLDLEYAYSIWFKVGGPFIQENRMIRNSHGLFTKRQLIAWAQEHDTYNATQIAYDLCDSVTRARHGDRMVEGAVYTYTLEERIGSGSDSRDEMSAMIDIILGQAKGVQTLPVPVADPEDDDLFAFEINTGCEAEQCSHYITVEITKEELLAWARPQTFQSEGSIEYRLEEWFKERDKTEEDDHSHEYDYGQDGYLQLEAMVALVKKEKGWQ